MPRALITFGGCRYDLDGQEVLLINTPWSHKSAAERRLIDDILAQLQKRQPVIVVYTKFDPATGDFEPTLRVISPREWQERIESRALPRTLIQELPIYEEDLLPRVSG
jgi:hypothetical protein